MYWIEHAMSQLVAGHWFRVGDFCRTPMFATRQELYTMLARPIADERVLYLEFGVFQGSSLRAASQLLRNPHLGAARFR